MFKFLLYKLGQFIVNRLSLEAAYKFATCLSDLQYFFSPRDRKAVKSNLKIIAPDRQDIDKASREVFHNIGLYLVEFFRMAQKVDEDYIRDNVKIHNVEYIHQVLNEGRGGIILTAHIGNWELGGIILSMLGFPITAIALPHKERPVNNLFNNQREAKGINVVPIDIALRSCLLKLKANELIALVGDRNFGTSGEMMKFFGKETLMPKGTARFALKTGAPIIPIFVVREEDHTFSIHIEEPIVPPEDVHSGEQENAIRALMGQYIPLIEDYVRRYPTQWLLFRDFWKDNLESQPYS